MAPAEPFGNRQHIQHQPVISGRGLGKGAARRNQPRHSPRQPPCPGALVPHPAQQQATDEKPRRFADGVVIVLRCAISARGADSLRVQGEQFTRAGAEPAIRAQQGKG